MVGEREHEGEMTTLTEEAVANLLREMVSHTQATQQAHRDVMAQMQAVLSAQTAATQGTGVKPHNRDVHKYFTGVD